MFLYIEIVKTIAEIAGALVGFVGIVFILGRRSERKLTVYEKNGLFHLLIGSVGTLLLSIVIMRYRSRPALLLAVLFAIPTMLLGFLTGSKRATLSPLMFLGLGYYVSVRRLSTRWSLVGAVMLITLYPIAQFYRESVLAGFQLSRNETVRL